MSHVTYADLGGLPNIDAVLPEPEGELFHANWEPRVLALTLAMGATGSWNIDMSRAARESLPDYAHFSYYQIWFEALQRMLDERGLLRPDAPALPRVLQAGAVPAVLAKGAPTLRDTTTGPRFAIGQRVRTRAHRVPHHTRLPSYAMGRAGVIERLHGMHVFADAHAQGLGEQPQWLYAVAFDAAELWGDAAAPGGSVSVDAWESYLDPAA